MSQPTGPDGEGTVEALLDRAEDMARSDPARAAGLAQRVVDAARAPTLVARAAYLLARRAVETGSPTEGLAWLERAAMAWRQAGDELAALRTTLGRSHALDELGRHDEALAALREAVERLDGLSTSAPDAQERATWLRAALHDNLGVALGFLGRSEEAIAAARQALAAWTAIGATEDAARAVGNLGVELAEVGRVEEAVASLDRAAEGFAALGDVVQAAGARVHSAGARLALGDRMQALAALDEAIDELDGAGAVPQRDRARLQRAALLLDVGWFGDVAAEAVAIAASAATDGRLPDVATARMVLAASLLARGRPSAATAADHAAEAAAATSAALVEVRCLLLRARADLAAGDLHAAAVLADELVGRCTANGWVVDGMRAELVLARATAGSGGAARMVPGHPSPAVVAQEVADRAAALGLRDVEADARHVQAVVAEVGGDPDGAIRFLRLAVDLLEAQRARVAPGVLHAAFLGPRAPVHTELVRLLLDRGTLGDAREAVRVIGLLRERSLLELRASAASEVVDAEARDGDRAAAARRELQRLLAEHGRLRASLEDDGDGASGREGERRDLPARGRPDLPTVLERLEVVASELDRLEVVLAPRPAGARHLAAAADGTGIPTVVYHLVGDELVAFVQVGDELGVLRDLLDGAVLDDRVRRLEGHWRRAAVPGLLARHAGALSADVDHELRELARSVLDPVLTLLGAVDRLAVVPHGALHAIPFAALPLTDDDEPSATRTRLVDRVALQVCAAPRASTEDATTGRGPAVAAPASRPAHGQGGAVAGGRVLVVGHTRADTPSVADELRGIAGAVGDDADVLAGDDATFALVRSRLPDAEVLHIAGHGVHDRTHPGLSAVQFADRFVAATELGQLPLGGIDVVLSACDTARRGVLSTIDDTGGLVSALLAAGAGTVVASLWPADDAATARLMVALHAARADGHGLDVALAMAQREVRDGGAHPYLWASFTCQLAIPSAAENTGAIAA